MIAHLFIHKGRFAWSGYGAAGDPAHAPFALVVDVGRTFFVTPDEPGRLYFKRRPDDRDVVEFSPEAFAIAARAGFFGFKVLHDHEAPARTRDRAATRRAKLDRRARAALDLEAR